MINNCLSLPGGFFLGDSLKNLIIDNYQHFERELTVKLRVEPENAGNHIKLTLDSECGSKEVDGYHRITCKGGADMEKRWETFSLEIKLNPEVCHLKENLKIVASVYGQTDSSLNINVGKIMCFVMWYHYV